MKIAFLDFEFTGLYNPVLDLVSAAVECREDGEVTYIREFWLFRDERGREAARRFFSRLMAEGYTFCAYVMEAEARSLLALYGDDRSWLKGFKALDLYLEYRCLLNHNHALAYGEQYLNGQVITTTPPPPKWLRDEAGGEDEEAGDSHHKPSYSLAAATFKLLGVKIDTAEKGEVRDIIIRGDEAEIQAARLRIQKYNASDIVYLRPMLKAVYETFLRQLRPKPREGAPASFKARYEAAQATDTQEWLKGALARGEYAVRTARMLALGYPVNLARVGKFTANIPKILDASTRACLDAAPEVQAFRWAKKEERWTLNEKAVRDWVVAQNLPRWRMTDGGKSKVKKLSLSKDAFADWYDSTSPGFGGAFTRHLKTKQSLNGFVPSPAGKRGVFTDFIGSDGRVRPNFGIYGSQASRSQPGAVGFIPLKAHWMRVFIEPPKGKALAQGDFASEEFLVAAILSQDDAMIRAYASGDVYLAFGKDAGLIPKDGTKATHKKERDLCKTVVLGISYDLSRIGLAPRLTALTGETWTEDRAQDLIDAFYDAYPTYKAWKEDTRQAYDELRWLALSDNWVMWGDNDNPRSVGNFPVQGEGAVIMRRAVALAQDAGLDVVYTVHDSLTIEFDAADLGAIETLRRCMVQGFDEVMSRYGKTAPVRVDLEAWSPAYAAALPEMPGVKFQAEHATGKGAADLARYRTFLE